MGTVLVEDAGERTPADYSGVRPLRGAGGAARALPCSGARKSTGAGRRARRASCRCPGGPLRLGLAPALHPAPLVEERPHRARARARRRPRADAAPGPAAPAPTRVRRCRRWCVPDRPPSRARSSAPSGHRGESRIRIPEDVPGTGVGEPVRDDVAAAIAVGVIPGIVPDHHAVAGARGAVGVPVAVAGVGVAVVADEARVVVVVVDVVGRNVVVVIAGWREPRRQVGEPDVGIALDASAVDQTIVPVVTPGDVAEVERVGGGDGEEVPHPRDRHPRGRRGRRVAR